MANKLKVGDTIRCSNENEMIEISIELQKEGIWADWLNIKDQPPKKWTLTITGVTNDD